MNKVLDFRDFSGGFEVLVDTGKSKPVATALLSFPNETRVTISGDESVVKQIVDRLDGLVVEYTVSDTNIKQDKAQ